MSDLTSKLSTLIESIQLSAKSSNSEIFIKSDRENLLKYFDELEERNEDLMDENRILSSALGEYFTQKKVTRAFHELNDKEYDNFSKNYHSKMEYLCKIKMKRQILQDEFEEKQSKVSKELEEATAAFNEVKNGKNLYKKLQQFLKY